MIADDEVHIRNLLKYLIHWEELGLELTGEFDNGQDLLSAAAADPPDLVITDIQMPEMDGLEMIRNLHDACPACRYIIISGYRDFSYAQSAVKLGVSDYILKPIEEEDLNSALGKIVRDPGRKEEPPKDRHRGKLVSVVLGQRMLDSVEEMNAEYGCRFSPDGIFMVVWMRLCRTSRESNVASMAEGIMDALRGRLAPICTDLEYFMVSRLSYAMLVQIGEDRKDLFVRTMDQAYGEMIQTGYRPDGERFYLSVGKAVSDPRDLRQSMESARFFINGRLTFGESRIYFADHMRKAESWQKESLSFPPEMSRRLEKAVEKGNAEEIREAIQQMFDRFREEDNPTLYVHMCRWAGETITRKLEQLGVNFDRTRSLTEDLYLEIENSDTVDMLRSCLTDFCVNAMQACLMERKKNPHAYIQMATDYIDAHFAENLSLPLIADKIHVNPAYLSALFKEETGKNYSEYLTERRMEEARTLLMNEDMSISEIAEAVGYNNTRYFSRLFETQTGVKPSEYRRLYLHRNGR